METTGRHLFTIRRDRIQGAAARLQAVTGTYPTYSGELHEPGVALAVSPTATVVYERLGIAVGTVEPNQTIALAGTDDIIAVEPERICYVTESDDYLRGFQAGVNATTSALISARGSQRVSVQAYDESQVTWGLQATGAATSRFSGRGVRVAILDTGLYSDHPDFIHRPGITTQSFINGVPTGEDGHGHGTHCAGTACGSATPQTLPRYGVASSAELFIGKVMNDQGFGVDGDILAGIDWALQQGCNVISMSLSSNVAPGTPFSTAYEQAAQAALEQGCLIVAAAGNASNRPANIAPIGHPANCPSILAVAAVDQQLQVAVFSCGQDGGTKSPWVSGPGVQVYSSWIAPRLYNVISGTSMATPHVAGLIALHLEATGLTGSALENAVVSACRSLAQPGSDVGGGLPQAP